MLIGFHVTLSEYSGEFVTVNDHLVILSRRRLDSCQIAPLRDSILKLQRLESNFFPKFFWRQSSLSPLSSQFRDRRVR